MGATRVPTATGALIDLSVAALPVLRTERGEFMPHHSPARLLVFVALSPSTTPSSVCPCRLNIQVARGHLLRSPCVPHANALGDGQHMLVVVAVNPPQYITVAQNDRRFFFSLSLYLSLSSLSGLGRRTKLPNGRGHGWVLLHGHSKRELQVNVVVPLWRQGLGPGMLPEKALCAQVGRCEDDIPIGARAARPTHDARTLRRAPTN